MKKGLLSLLALALTVVGCQNYDDQFDELTSQITSLQSTVDGLTGVSSAIVALQADVTAITAALTGIRSTVNGLENYDDTALVAQLQQLGTISSTLGDLQAQLTSLQNGVATAAELATISNTLGDVQADVRELLNANATISQAILINSSASLQYVESLIATGTDDPNVIVNNTVTIDTGSLTDPEKARANQVAAKIATVIGTVTIIGDEEITMSELTYVDGDYIVSGADHSEPKLASITGDLIITQEVAAPLTFGILSSVTNIVGKGSTLATATSIDLSGVTVSGSVGTGTNSSTLVATQANGTIDLGTVDNFDQIDANLADVIIIEDAAAYPTALTINAAVASRIDISNATSIGGALTIVATDSTVLNADSLTGTLTASVAAGDLGTANLDGIVEVTGDLGVSTLNADNLSHLGFTGTINLDELTSLDFPDVLIGSSAVGTAKAASVSVASIDDLDFTPLTDLAGGVVRSLTIGAQTSQVSLTATAQAANLKTLSIVLTGNDLGIDVEVSGTNSITALTIGGTARDVDIVSNTALATLTTNGFINDFQASTLAALTSLDVNHTYSADFTSPFNFEANALANITSLNLSSLNKVFTLTITNNSDLEDITAPLNTIPITVDALNGTTPDITVTGNSIQATYTDATATIPSDGISAQTDFVSSTIESASLSSIKAFILANLNVDPATTYDIDWDVHYGGVNADFNAAIIADCAEAAGPDNAMTTASRVTGSTCAATAGAVVADDADKGISDGGEIDTAYELAKIQ